jgi:hypothetical protein
MITGPYARSELISDWQGQKVVVYPIISSSERDWKIKSASSLGNSKSAEMDCQRAAKLSSLISNRQTKTASSPGDVVQIDFHTDATYSNRIPIRQLSFYNSKFNIISFETLIYAL